MKKKLLRTIIFILLAVVFVIGISIFLNAESRAEEFLISKIDEQIGEEFHFNFDESDWGFFNRSVSFRNIELSRTKGDSLIWESSIGQIDLYGFGIYEFLVGQVYRMDSLTLTSPVINLFDLRSSIDSSHTPHHGVLKKVAIDFGVQKIQVKNGKLTYDPHGPEYLSAKYSSRVVDLQIDGNGAPINNYVDNAEILISDVHYVTPDSLSTIEIGKMGTRLDEKAFVATDLSVKSNYSISEYSALYNWRKAMFEVEVDTLTVDMSELVNWSELLIPSVKMSGLNLAVSQNLRFPLPNRVTELPQSMVRKTELLFQIDTVIFENSRVDYVAYLNHNQVSETKLTGINAELAPLQNTDLQKPLFSLEASSTLYGAAPLTFQAVYHYGENDPFEFSGSVGRTKLEFLDDFLFNAAGIEIASGALDRLDFSVSGNKYGTTGYSDFYYQDLEIKALNQETGKYKVGLNTLSNVLGGLVFWKSNPAHDQYRRGNFQMQRDGRKGFVSQWIDSILEGIIATVSKVDPVIVRGNKKKKKK